MLSAKTHAWLGLPSDDTIAAAAQLPARERSITPAETALRQAQTLPRPPMTLDKYFRAGASYRVLV